MAEKKGKTKKPPVSRRRRRRSEAPEYSKDTEYEVSYTNKAQDKRERDYKKQVIEAQKEYEARTRSSKVSIDEGKVDPQDVVASDMQEGIIKPRDNSEPLSLELSAASKEVIDGVASPLNKSAQDASKKAIKMMEQSAENAELSESAQPAAPSPQKKKSFLAGVVEFFKGIPAAIQSLFSGSSDSSKFSKELSAPQDKELIKSSIADIAPAIEEILQDERLAPDIREKAEKVQEGAKQVGDEYSLNEFKMAVGELQELTKSFKDGYKDTAAYKLAHLSSTVSGSLRDVSLLAAPADAPYASSAESAVDMKKQAKKIGDASKHLKSREKSAQGQKSKPKSQNSRKSSPRSMSV